MSDSEKKQNIIVEKIETYLNGELDAKLIPPVLYKLSELDEKNNNYPNGVISEFHKDSNYWVLDFYKPMSKIYIA